MTDDEIRAVAVEAVEALRARMRDGDRDGLMLRTLLDYLFLLRELNLPAPPQAPPT